MPIHTYFVKENARRAEIDEYLSQELKRAGYSKVEMTKTPLGTRVVIYAAKPGLVIGRRGQSIRDLTKILEEKFSVENPQISVATVEIPELDPKVVASQIAMALQRGIHFRRAAYWALQRTIEAGALGVEICIRGKLTTDRARYEKYRAGYLPAVGEAITRILRTAVVDTQLKQGLFGISVKLMPPNVTLPDRPTIKEIEQTPTVPKPVIEEVVTVESTAEIQEVAEIADTKKA
ncbi:MAG: 30S ribosomal protein S3 [Candidatus Bathyarchaeia archaeon]